MNTSQPPTASSSPTVPEASPANILNGNAIACHSLLPGQTQAQDGSSSCWQKWLNFLRQPIDAASLAVFRVCFGATMLVYCWQLSPFLPYFYQDPKLHFPILPGLEPLPAPGMQIVLAVMSFSAACVVLGMRYRVAAAVLFVSYTYTFLLEKAYYQNHYYLMALLSFLFCFIPANRVWSVDNGMRSGLAPRWSLLILRAQIVVVYFFSGIAKLNTDWLIRQEPLHQYMHTLFQGTALFNIVTQPWFASLVTWGGAAFDLTIGFLLWFTPTFGLAAALALAFHLTNAFFFSIGVFPWLMIATIPLFASPEWPRRLRAKIPLLAKGDDTTYAAWARQTRLGTPEVESEQSGGGKENLSSPTATTATAKAPQKTSILVIAFLHLYLIGQMVIPIRHFFYPNNNESWTERGHLFSWHMMLRNKEVKYFEIVAVHPRLGSKIDTARYDTHLNDKQVKVMKTNPAMILRFAHYIADDIERTLGVRPIIHAIAIESLNARPNQFLINPQVDLASVKESDRPDWILPLGDKQAIRYAASVR